MHGRVVYITSGVLCPDNKPSMVWTHGWLGLIYRVITAINMPHSDAHWKDRHMGLTEILHVRIQTARGAEAILT